jgi:hypothetical protein
MGQGVSLYFLAMEARFDPRPVNVNLRQIFLLVLRFSLSLSSIPFYVLILILVSLLSEGQVDET